MINKVLLAIHSGIYRALEKTNLRSKRHLVNFLKHGYRLTEYLYLFLRCQKPIVRRFGYCYSPSRDQIEIDITYRCNLACNSCNRSLGIRQARSVDGMSLEQIERFVAESVENKVRWKVIRVLGGEPTLHPQFFEVLAALLSYKQSFAPQTDIQVWSNGCGNKVQGILARIPDGVSIVNTSKTTGSSPLFNAFNLAAMDSPLYRYVNYANGCSITEKCGVGLTPYGYYPCAIAGGIDRVVGLDKGAKQLATAYAEMRDQLDSFCRYCGHFRMSLSTTEQCSSTSWQIAYQRYKQKRPSLTAY